MVSEFKKRLFFVGARYFRFWAKISLKKWHPRVIVVTGSAGKTTLLHMIEAQLGKKAHYSHHANSSYGLPFDILSLSQVENSRFDWLRLFLIAPFKSLTAQHHQEYYIAEADADRPSEGRFLADLLKPEVTLWVSVLHTHTAQFDEVVGIHTEYKTPEQAIAAEYGHLAKAANELVIADGDNALIKEQVKNLSAKVIAVSKNQIEDYSIKQASSQFSFSGKNYSLPGLHPRSVYTQVAMVDVLMEYLGFEPDLAYSQLKLPPGRSSLLHGIKGSLLIDSTYNNSNLDSLIGVVQMFERYPYDGKKWAVIGDLLEQGKDEQREHEKLAKLINETTFEKIILFGPRTSQYVAPKLSRELVDRTKVAVYEQPKQVLNDLLLNITGNQAIMFKGVRFLEGVIEALLANPEDSNKLVRRGKIWQKRRKEWGL